jgi:hypothetical protein
MIRTFQDLLDRMEFPTRLLGGLEGESICWATTVTSFVSQRDVRITSHCRVPQGVTPQTLVFPHCHGFSPDHGEAFWLECGR